MRALLVVFFVVATSRGVYSSGSFHIRMSNEYEIENQCQNSARRYISPPPT